MDSAELARLEGNLNRSRLQFDSWTKERVNQVEKVERECRESSLRAAQEAAALAQRQASYEAAAARLQERLEAEREELEALERGVAQLEARAAALPVKQQELEQEIAERKRDLERRRALLNACEEARRTRLMHLQKALVWYRDRLGLRFQRVGDVSGTDAGRVDGKVRVVFRHIDARDPNREFAFTVYVDQETDTFRVEDCNPNVDAIPMPDGTVPLRLAQMVDALNRTNDFGAFVAQMRRRFKAFTQAEEADQSQRAV
ncbi:hypothetical protein F1559_001402 [Cyanidiococcus yangmingshanensis]|uniref:Kinetochore protein SPC25 n=1 Tax=Cyanidiococcus yangmingshanensis TaxID=2690220 RepID=A0A7J7IHI2_9RHOD|nr:hypothetical protein F1559_001402 [Cyanidiococcus yangmingshanensis]